MKLFGKIAGFALVILMSACKKEEISPGLKTPPPRYLQETPDSYAPPPSTPVRPIHIHALPSRQRFITPVTRKRRKIS